MAESVSRLDGCDSPEQLGRRNQRIVLREPVTAGDQPRTMVAASVSHDPVREQTALARIQHDFPWGYFGYVRALDRNQFAWKNGRYHAGAKYTEANLSKRADNFHCQTTRQSRGRALRWDHKPFTRRAMKLSC